MIVITGAARFADGNRAAFEQVAGRQVTLPRREPGNVPYSYFEDRLGPGRFLSSGAGKGLSLLHMPGPSKKAEIR